MNRIDTSKKKANWRTEATHNLYMSRIDAGDLDHGCALCEAPTLHMLTHWRIVVNKYPYDRVADLHHMIIPVRHTSGDDLTQEELTELEEAKRGRLNDTYEFVVEALPRTKSVPGHFHLHLITSKHF
ncbi:MAG TPA: hypothetical protein VGE31_01180 [Candidatus Paceibacterota bacterium]